MKIKNMIFMIIAFVLGITIVNAEGPQGDGYIKVYGSATIDIYNNGQTYNNVNGISYNNSSNTLSLNNFTAGSIEIYNMGDLKINVFGTSTINGTLGYNNNACITAEGTNLTVDGNGTLNLNGTAFQEGLDLTIKNITLNSTIGSVVSNFANVTLDSTTINANSENPSEIYAGEDITINKSNLNIISGYNAKTSDSGAINGDKSLTIIDSDLILENTMLRGDNIINLDKARIKTEGNFWRCIQGELLDAKDSTIETYIKDTGPINVENLKLDNTTFTMKGIGFGYDGLETIEINNSTITATDAMVFMMADDCKKFDVKGSTIDVTAVTLTQIKDRFGNNWMDGLMVGIGMMITPDYSEIFNPNIIDSTIKIKSEILPLVISDGAEGSDLNITNSTIDIEGGYYQGAIALGPIANITNSKINIKAGTLSSNESMFNPYAGFMAGQEDNGEPIDKLNLKGSEVVIDGFASGLLVMGDLDIDDTTIDITLLENPTDEQKTFPALEGFGIEKIYMPIIAVGNITLSDNLKVTTGQRLNTLSIDTNEISYFDKENIEINNKEFLSTASRLIIKDPTKDEQKDIIHNIPNTGINTIISIILGSQLLIAGSYIVYTKTKKEII